MTSREFCYWFQGWLEIQNPSFIEESQLDVIKKHLNLVFKHEIDPSYGDDKKQKILNDIHNPNNKLIRC